MSVRVAVTDRQRALRIPARDVKSLVRHVLAREGAVGEIEVAFVDDEAMTDLHGRFSGDASPTDVLTFPDGATPRCARGEIVVSTETAKRQAPRFLKDPRHEALLYVVHGVLHLLGYDDRDATARRRMSRRQSLLFREWRAAR